MSTAVRSIAVDRSTVYTLIFYAQMDCRRESDQKVQSIHSVLAGPTYAPTGFKRRHRLQRPRVILFAQS